MTPIADRSDPDLAGASMDWLTSERLTETIGPVAPQVTVIAAIVFLSTGVACCVRGKGNSDTLIFGIPTGIALVTSGFLAFVIWLLQGLVDNAADAEQTISLTTSISGFNPEDLPPGVDLDDINFNGKTLDAAQLAGADLADRDFQDAVLTRADLAGADLSGANLIAVDLTDAELTDADLSGADLKSARFEHAGIEGAESLEGAEVNGDTCWPQSFLEESPLAVGLETADGVVSTASTADDGMFGHACTKEPTEIITTTVPAEADGSFVAVPPKPGARVKDIDWVPTASGPNAYVTWIVEPSDR